MNQLLEPLDHYAKANKKKNEDSKIRQLKSCVDRDNDRIM